MTRFLQPLHLREKYYAEIQRRINEVFWQTIYAPLVAQLEVDKKEITNSTNPVIDALNSGSIFYEGGAFHGAFTSKISRELKSYGATFNRVQKTWVTSDFPMQVTVAIAESNVRQEAAMKRMISTIDALEQHQFDTQLDLFRPYEKTVAEINEGFAKTVKSVSIVPQLTPAMQEAIAKEWGANLEIYIKEWRSKNIVKLRSEIVANVMAGKRSGAMVKTIQANYGVSRDKAKFLARQETSLLLAKMSQQRYKDIGVTRYKWSGANDERERADHKALNGKIFTWDSPPVTNKQTGARNHPSEDFGCRCVAIPILDEE